MTQPARANMLHDLGYKIFLDRYALKDMTRETLAVGDIVVALVDPDTRQREIGTVDAIDLPQITITLRDGTTVTCNIEEVDKPLETDPGQMMDRVARGVAAVEVSEAGQAQWAERFRWLLEDWKFVPGGRILAAAGTSQNLTFYNCYVLPSPDDSRDGIIETLRQMTEIMSRGGGVGINISSLRPRYAYVRGVNGRSSGTVSWGELYSFVTGLIEQGGCLIPDTLVFTENGLLRLDEMVQHTERGWREQTITVKTDQGERVSRRVYNNGVADVLSVQTDMGLTLIGTPNHKVKVMTDEGPVWRELEHLQTGDAILVKLNQHQGKLQTLEHPEYHHFNQVEVDLPTVVDEDLAFFLGYFMGDGFMTTREGDWRLGVAVAHSSYLVDEMPKMLERLFPGVNVRIQQKDEDASLIYLISNRALKEFLILNGLDKPASDAVHIPRLIRQSPREVVGAFLSGLFEADGGISHNYPSLSSISKRLIDETATLLIGLGCPVRIDQFPYSEDRFGSNPVWRLRVHSVRGLQAWKATIGCDPRSRYAACMGFEPDLNRESTYVLPNPEYWVEPVLAATMLPQGDFRATGQRFKATDGKLRRKLLRYKRGDRNLTLSAYMTLEKTHDAFARHARPVNDTWFVFVDSVEPAGQSLTLDLEVDENHTYLANGLVTHNSRRGALMLILNDWHPDILEFTNVKRNMDRMNNANISVGVSDRLMAAIENDEDWDLVFPDTDEPGYDDLWDGDLDKWIADGHKVIHYETVKARDLWNAIIESAWASAEPGIWFRERTNKLSNSHYFSPLISTNPCVTGDTLLYTDQGLQRAQELFDDETQIEVTVDGRFGLAGATTPASRVFRTGTKPVYRLQTKEGYFVRATADHRFMTPRGWVELQDLAPGDKLHILNRKGGFGGEGSLALGRVLGAANTKAIQEPVVAMQQAKNETIRSGLQTRPYNDTLHLVPETVFMGSEDMQRGFLQAFFTDHADFQHSEIRCLSDQCELLEGVQQILLNFGIASRINRDYQELTISDQNIFAFVDEIGFLMDYKQAALTDYITRGKRGPYRETFTATVEAITEDGIEDVFDVTEPITHSIVVNGLVAHN
ncbi:MAG: hypothetical protein JXA10_05625, partial [Anaerolineae bacterium]|nr:hypothetical protein [Anaerolineae bacterium]